MRSKLLAGTALLALFLAVPAISLVSPEGETRRGPSPLDPLSASLAVCRTKADGQATRRGLFIAAARAYAQTVVAPADSVPPLLDGVASSALAVTANDAARPYFEQGLGLLDGFNHFEAVRAFRAAQVLDPDCALCFWGEAYALGPNINDPMDPAHNARALEAARIASEKAEAASEVEQALIEAI